jgi:hypothetical protein
MQVGEDRAVVLTVGGAHMTPPGFDPHALRPHHTGNAFVVDRMAPAPELIRHPAVAVSRKLILSRAEWLKNPSHGSKRCD